MRPAAPRHRRYPPGQVCRSAVGPRARRRVRRTAAAPSPERGERGAAARVACASCMLVCMQSWPSMACLAGRPRHTRNSTLCTQSARRSIVRASTSQLCWRTHVEHIFSVLAVTYSLRTKMRPSAGRLLLGSLRGGQRRVCGKSAGTALAVASLLCFAPSPLRLRGTSQQNGLRRRVPARSAG
eukprot:240341-Chlamydomonas_euryale.AAC.3